MGEGCALRRVRVSERCDSGGRRCGIRTQRTAQAVREQKKRRGREPARGGAKVMGGGAQGGPGKGEAGEGGWCSKKGLTRHEGRPRVQKMAEKTNAKVAWRRRPPSIKSITHVARVIRRAPRRKFAIFSNGRAAALRDASTPLTTRQAPAHSRARQLQSQLPCLFPPVFGHGRRRVPRSRTRSRLPSQLLHDEHPPRLPRRLPARKDAAAPHVPSLPLHASGRSAVSR